ncbi:MAG: PfkB family carbohydrate kinase [Opitutaceae bacterium]|jgi:fructose-1-phosphate kinase PfkB-like protein|nr:PfkB family carbohydrate kinase [Opitutaceae bacterium]
MILTLTGNLLAERTLEFDAWRPGRTQRARRASFQVGGKGVNVSKMLTRLGAPTTALCFAGGAPGDECAAWLRENGIGHHIFRTDAATRTGAVIRAPGQPETTFLGPDAAPDAGALAACAAWLDARLPDAQTALALCGSFPGWDAAGGAILRAALARWAGAGRLFVDAYGPPLAWAVAQPAGLIKINRDELIQLAGGGPAAAARPTAELLARTRRRHPAVRRWIISDGPREVWFADAGDAPPASLLPPPVREISPTGSGDVLLACVLHRMLINHEKSLAKTLIFALPYSAANAASPGVADFNLNQLPNQRSVSIP